MKKKHHLIAAAALSLFLVACGDKQSTASAPAAVAPVGSVAIAPAPDAPAPVVVAPEAAAPVAVATPDAAAPAAAAITVADNTVGKSVYGKACALCHAAGVAGAPKPGDKEAWATRVAQGKETLYKHAIEGYTGANGMMPARGGNSTLSDDDVKAAVNFMADQSV